jgi:predicted Fe-S protein YdhL (DUF1289 family)
MTEKVFSPCLGLCVVDNDGVCIGCFRHITEITEWNEFSEQEKKYVLVACAERKSEYKNNYK